MVFSRKHSSLVFRLIVLLVLVFMASFFVLPLKTAHALATAHAIPGTSCSGNPPCSLDGSNPYATGCAGNGKSYYVVESAKIYNDGTYLGYVQLWYSGTCNTNWGRTVPVNSSSGLNADLSAYINGQWQQEGQFQVCSGGSSCWDPYTDSYDLLTGQYYIPGPAGQFGCVFPVNSEGGCNSADQ